VGKVLEKMASSSESEDSKAANSSPVDTDKVDAFREVFEASLLDIAKRTLEEERCIILSGGVDTCAIMAAAKKIGVKFQAGFTVITGEESPDKGFSEACAKEHNLKHFFLRLTADDLINTQLQPCVQLVEGYTGMLIRNSLVVAAAFRKVAEEGYKHAIVGDAADELFGGYSFMWIQEGDDWKVKRDNMCARWTFATESLANFYGVKTYSPYMEPRTVDWAIANTVKADCIGTRPIQLKYGEEFKDHMTGKLILREAYETVSSWRRKDPIEIGSGVTVIGHDPYWADIVSDDEFKTDTAALLERGYVIKSKEDLTNFRVFEKTFNLNGGLTNGSHPKTRYPIGDDAGCIGCCFEIGDSMFCHVCGAYPAQRSGFPKDHIT
jgi:asparagine synthase (glutamine-hydrolysing)